MPRDALPPSVSRPWLAVAALVWLTAWLVTTLTSPPPLSEGPVTATGKLSTDPFPRFGEHVALVEVEDLGTLLLELDDVSGLLRGASVAFDGEMSGGPGQLAATPYLGRVSVSHLTVIEEAPLLYGIGEGVRERVLQRLDPLRDGSALLAGFLIGDTSGLTRDQLESMRRAGLSHFVAVSGSNVALFIGLLVVAAGPLALGPRRRAIVGLVGLPVYVAATRFEPSVLRASVMAGLALGGRLVGVVFEAWQLLSLAVVLLLVSNPYLTTSAGFQLSVAATAGVLVGARWPVRGGKPMRALAVTAGAQAAVAPLILVHFGSVPLLSPLVNLLAGPLVAASTVLGAVGVVGLPLLVDLASATASVVLMLASGSAGWPQLEAVGLLSLALGLAPAIKWPRLRPAAFTVGAAVLAVTLLGWGRAPPVASVTVLDVGQGDAILLHGGDGRFALVDGGPEQVVLVDRLRELGVDELELVVLTHVHADHAAGLIGLPGRVGIGRLWERTEPDETEASKELIERVSSFGIPISQPEVGDHWDLGALELVVEGPLRRYAGPNDQSIVLTVRGPVRDMLLSGDVEVVAQSELGHLRADVLKVPHHGAGTSDPDWLRGVGADLAVISVGTNDFGHPADWVVDLFTSTKTQLLRTDRDGNVTVPLG